MRGIVIRVGTATVDAGGRVAGRAATVGGALEPVVGGSGMDVAVRGGPARVVDAVVASVIRLGPAELSTA